MENSLDRIKEIESRTEEWSKKVKKISEEVFGQTKIQKDLSSQIKEQRLTFRAESSRALGLIAEQNKVYFKSFYWWARAAYYFDELGEDELVNTALNASQRALESMKKEIGEEIRKGNKISISMKIKHLLEDRDETEVFIKNLAKKHNEKVDSMERLIKEIINTKT